MLKKVQKPQIQPAWEQCEQTTKSTQLTDPLEVIYNEGQWKLSTMSPLYDFHYDKVKLKQYSSKVRQTIVSSITASSSIKYVVQFEEQTDLKYMVEDPNALKITILTTEESTNKSKVAYTAVLLSWGVYTKLDGAIHLPYLIERGEQKLSTFVKATLQTVFDCNIKQITFTQHQLLELGLNCLDLDTSPDLSQFVLNYKSLQTDVKDKLTIAFAMRDIKLIWNGSKEEVLNESELVNFTYKILQNQMFHVATLDLSCLELCEVLLPRAEIRNNGMVRMKTPGIVNCVFTLLNKVCNLDSTKSSLVDISNI